MHNFTLMSHWISGGDNANDTPHYAAHSSFVTNPRVQTCGIITDVYVDEQCDFVRRTPECTDSMQYLDYMEFLYCFVPMPALFPVKLIGLVRVALCVMYCCHIVLCVIIAKQMLLCCLIFVVLGMTADTL